MPKTFLFPIPVGSGPSGKYAVNLSMTIDDDYVISANLVDQDGNVLGNVQTIDLPLESVVVSGRYDAASKNIVLTLSNGNEITIPVGGLVSGLVSQDDFNELSGEVTSLETDVETLETDVDTLETNIGTLTEELETKADKVPYISIERMDNYFYKITFAELPEYVPSNDTIDAGCSSFVKNGRLFRNLDWKYSETNSFLVKTKDFTGMAFNDSVTDNNMNPALIGQLPYRIVDGVNNHGIMGSVHVLTNDFEWQGTGNTPLTKGLYEILTRVTSMETIETELSPIISDLYATSAMVEANYLLQFLVTDGTTTYVLTPSSTGYELVDITALPRLTNFKWVNKATLERNDTDLQQHPTGVERWNLIAEPTSLEDLRFTLAYEAPTRLSEFIGINNTDKDSTDAELTEIYNTAHTKYQTRTRNGELWQTMHSVVYTSDGIEHLSVQENWERDYFFDKDTVYTAGDNVTITNNVISATDTTYTAGEGIDITDNVISATGGGGNQWFGTQREFDALGTYDPDTEYFISDKIDYNTDIKNKPDLGSFAQKSYVDGQDAALDVKINGKLSTPEFMTQAEFDAITPVEGKNYMIENETVAMTFTFADDTTATYYVLRNE